MAPRKKAVKVALNDFLGGGSWADDVEELPTAPSSRPEGFSGSSGGDFMSRPDRGERSDYPSREELPLPTAPPYTAFVGNLAFDVAEPDVENYFEGLKLNSVKIINDMEGKPKGFGYVEFASLDDLKEGLSRGGGQLAARTVRVSVAEPPKSGARSGGFGGGLADEKSEWRRSGPLPPLPGGDRAGGPRAFGNSPRRDEDEPERDWGAARGSRFVPSAESSPHLGGGGFGGPGGGGPERRSGGFVSESGAAAEAASQWRTGKPLSGPSPATAGFGGPRPDRDALPHQRAPRPDIPAGPADTEKEWVRGAKFVPAPENQGRPQREFQARPGPPPGATDEPSDWRTGPRRGPPSRQGSAENSAAASPQPASRRPMSLLPRSGSTGASTPESSSDSPAPSSKASPFGAARPVDASVREKEVADKLAKQAAEAKAAREVKQAEIKAAREKEQAEKAAAGPAAGGVEGGKKGVRSPPTEPANWRSAKPPAAAAGASKQAPVVAAPLDKDVVPKKAPVEKKKADGKKDFSFAALAVEGGDDDDVDEVAEGVEKL